MFRRNRATVYRSTPSPFVVMIGAGLMLAVAGLVFWPRSPIAKSSGHHHHHAHRALEQGKSLSSEPTAVGGARVFFGKISGSLPRSFQKYLDKERATLLSALAARLLIWRLDIRRHMRRGDRIRLLYQSENSQSKYRILAMTYHSKKYGKTFHFYRYKERGSRFAAYYDRDGREIERKLQNTPLRRYDQVTSILKMRPRHKGVDFKAPTGTKVYNPWRGRVIRKNWNTRYNGYCLEMEYVRKGKKIRGLYLHLEKLMKIARPGAVIPAGKVIGLVGNTGRSTAAHLHYQLQTPAGKVIDPFDAHTTYLRDMPKAERKAFRQSCSRFDRLLAAAR